GSIRAHCSSLNQNKLCRIFRAPCQHRITKRFSAQQIYWVPTLDIFGNSFRHQSGALFTKDRDRYNGFSTLRMVSGHPHVRVDLETYFPVRREFDPAVDIVPQGIFFSSSEARKFWDTLLRKLERASRVGVLQSSSPIH